MSKRRAGRELKVSAPTILDWLSGAKAPSKPHREAIKVWTSGEIVESDWATDRELKQVQNASEVKPFEPDPKPEEPAA